MITIKEEISVVAFSRKTNSVQMSDGYWEYIGLAYELVNPPPDLCREETMELDIERFYRSRVSAMEQLLSFMEAGEKLLAESYFNVSNFPLDRFIRLCSERCESALPGDEIANGFQMMNMQNGG